MKTFKITKRFSRKISRNYNSYEFVTELTTDAEVETAEQLQAAADKLFDQAKILTLNDIELTMKENTNVSNG
jgi:hypothetical protein